MRERPPSWQGKDLPFLAVPGLDTRLRMSFLAAQREHVVADGRADAGLPLEDLASDSIWNGYVRGRIALFRQVMAPRLNWPIRPSRRDEDHDEALIAAVLPVFAAQGFRQLVVECAQRDTRYRTVITWAGGAITGTGGRPESGAAGRARYVLATC